jgi:hypothetical protein
MPHYPGHLPNGTLVIEDRRITKTYHVHGYLFVDKVENGKEIVDEKIRILFMNNCQMDMPGNVSPKGDKPGSIMELSENQQEARKVGFHLLLIDMPKVNENGKSKWGIAYNLAKWEDHENTEKSIQVLNKYKGKRVEDIDPSELIDLSEKIKNNIGDGQTINAYRNKKTDKDTAALILKQSGEYMKTSSFRMTRAGDNHYEWIKNNVADFEDMAKLFGEYAPAVRKSSVSNALQG